LTRDAKTKTRQDETAATGAVERNDAVELNDAALDQVAAGTFYGTGVYKTTDGGRDR